VVLGRALLIPFSVDFLRSLSTAASEVAALLRCHLTERGVAFSFYDNDLSFDDSSHMDRLNARSFIPGMVRTCDEPEMNPNPKELDCILHRADKCPLRSSHLCSLIRHSSCLAHENAYRRQRARDRAFSIADDA
jgi:hypothetical protein